MGESFHYTPSSEASLCLSSERRYVHKNSRFFFVLFFNSLILFSLVIALLLRSPKRHQATETPLRVVRSSFQLGCPFSSAVAFSFRGSFLVPFLKTHISRSLSRPVIRFVRFFPPLF